MKIYLGVNLFSFIELEACVPFNTESSVFLVQEVVLYFFPLAISSASFSSVLASRTPNMWLSALLDRVSSFAVFLH